LEDELPREVLRDLNRILIESPKTTYDLIKDWLTQKGYPDLKRSSIGRYAKRVLEGYDKAKIFEEKAMAVVSATEGDGFLLEDATAKSLAQKMVEIVSREDFNERELSDIIDNFTKLQRSTIMRERLKSEISTRTGEGPKIDRPALFLESLEFIAGFLKEKDPEGLKVLANNFDDLISQFKTKNAPAS
jgi:hypothetical protein